MNLMARSLGAMFRMARPSHLLLIAFVYIVGGAMAAAKGAQIDAAALLAGLLALIPMSMSVHFANEYADFETDARTRRTPFSGGSGALPGSGLPRGLALAAAWASLAIALGIAGVSLGSGSLKPAALALLILGGAMGWMYSLPPLALAWKGWGELDNALAGGLVLPLYGYATLAGRLDLAAVAACAPFVALAFLNLLATTWPDREADTAAGKCTLATLWPVGRLRILYWLVAAGGFASIPLLMEWSMPRVVAGTSLALIPLVVLGGLRYTRSPSPLASVAPMVTMAFVQFLAWFSRIG